ncbi:MAG TPA: 50S ribosomal protein L25 [Candidatus Melainabacteria bacterium]|nr:50S ribosomal protein L25 [Candidatus Melainabacteria bacterium]HIN65746.1 50S ribosomal protein L25 [Candidatus Obscuribacterales bacterium]
MDKIKLAVAAREDKTPRQLRREAKIPATLYGPGQPSENVQIDAKEFSRLPKGAYSHMIELEMGKGKPVNAIIREVQRRGTTHEVLNVELYRVALDRKLTVTVPLKFIGVSTAVTVEGGQLIEVFQDAEIECLPGDIPDFIEADVSLITEIDQGLHFGELKISDKIKILNPEDEVVARVVAKKSAAEETPATAASEGAAAPEPAAAAS